MSRLPVLFMLFLLISMTIISCDDYEDDVVCTCPHGGSIGGWEEPDTTSVHQNDTTGGFEITLEDWGNTETHDISL